MPPKPIPLTPKPTTPPPLRAWQAEALPLALASVAAQLAGDEKPALIAACTGSGKSRLIAEVLAARTPRLIDREVIVITTPTRRLVRQLAGTARAALAEPVAEHYTAAKWRSGGGARVIVCCNASAPNLAARLAAGGYRVNLWIADEAHRTETPEIHQFAADAPAAAALAVTATPYRSDDAERLRLWDRLLYQYAPSQALADRVLVPWRAVPWQGADGAALDDAAIEMIKRHHSGPGVVNALSCDDAEQFAGKLTRAGILAAAIHSRIPARAQDALIEDLKRGRLAALVYPSLLCEGVDLPWLRWGCLRRPVKSRVRFIQELGRFLRTAPGKKEAVILDPLGLLEQHATRIDAALGWVDDPEPAAAPEPMDPADDLADADKIPPAALVARVADALGAYARNLLYLAIQDGHLDPKLAPQAASWRRQPASQRQRDYLARLAERNTHMQPEHLAQIRKITRSGLLSSSGAAGDLITLLKSLRDPFAPGSRLAPISDAAIERAAEIVQSEPVYVAGAQRGGVVALAAVRAGQTLAIAVRDVGRNVAPVAVEIAAIRLGAIAGLRSNAPRPVIVSTSSRPAMEQIKSTEPISHGQIRAAVRHYYGAALDHQLRVLEPAAQNPATGAAWAALARRRRGSRS